MNYSVLARNIRFYRLAAGISTQYALAEKLGINTSSLSSLECGWRTRFVRLETLVKISDVCGVLLFDLLETKVDRLASAGLVVTRNSSSAGRPYRLSGRAEEERAMDAIALRMLSRSGKNSIDSEGAS